MTIATSLLVLRPAPPAHAARQPLLLRIQGWWGAAPAGTQEIRKIQVQIGTGKLRTFAVRDVANLGRGPLGLSILDDAARYRPSLRFVGDRPLVEKLASAPQGRMIQVTGQMVATRTILLGLVDVEGEVDARTAGEAAVGATESGAPTSGPASPTPRPETPKPAEASP